MTYIVLLWYEIIAINYEIIDSNRRPRVNELYISAWQLPWGDRLTILLLTSLLDLINVSVPCLMLL